MDVFNLSWNEALAKRFNHPLLPRSIRGLIVGKSGCGKTTLLLNLLLHPDWLDYDNLCVFGKSLFQPEYRILKKAFEEEIPKEYILRLFSFKDEVQRNDISPLALVEEWAKTIKEKSDIKCEFFENASDVPDPRNLNAENKNLMIFDDLLLEKQGKCENYYVRGRHSNADCFYIAQIFFELPRRTIRGNSNLIILFKLPKKDQVNIFTDYVSEDMEFSEFRNFCKKCWNEPHGFVVIDLTSNANNGKYRCGFDNFYMPINCKLNRYYYFKLNYILSKKI